MNIETPSKSRQSSSSHSYYDGPELVDQLSDALRGAGLDPDDLSPDDLAALDEFHALGRAATIALADLAGIEPGTRVLDVGAGLAGPARFLAQRYEVQVTALDATARFCRAAEMLTRGTGLADRVHIIEGDALALPFEDDSFDMVWTQAVTQNVADKVSFAGEIARVLRPGGRVAMFEILAGPGGALEFPVPWADREDQSWLVTADELRSLLGAAGLEVTTWNEGPKAVAAIGQAAQQVKMTAAAERLGLDVLMPDFKARMAGLASNVAHQKIVLVQVIAQRR
jgi:MPBQ/MSBQ methyltransferase